MMQPRKWYKFIGTRQQIELSRHETFILKGAHYLFYVEDENELFLSKTNNGYKTIAIYLSDSEQDLFQEITPTWKNKLQLKGVDEFDFGLDDEE